MATEPSDLTKTFTLLPPGTSSLKLSTPEDLAPHTAALTSPTAPSQIQALNLSGTSIGVSAAQSLATSIRSLTNLHTANIADIFTGRLLNEIPPALDSLLDAILALPNVHTVHLSDNAFGLNTAAPLVRFLEKHVPLRHLLLNNNGLGPEAGTLIADALTRLAEAKKFHDGPQLETIVCGRNRLENGSMAAWSRAVAAHGTGLRTVRMVQNGIRQEGIQTLLSSGLGRAEGLKVLDLQDNTFTRSSARVLADVVARWEGLVELGVGDCLLSARGMVMLGEALAKGANKELEVLRLQYNEIDARGVQSIVTALEKDTLPKLRRVEINGNKFAEEDASVERLREILQQRKEGATSSGKADGPKDADEDDYWGIDDLSDLEEESEEEEEDMSEKQGSDEETELNGKEARDLKHTDEAENENVAEEKDKDVDSLADQLGKTGI